MAKCGQCPFTGSSENYLDHVCEKTGFKPTEPENLGAEFVAISEAAVQRGTERKRLEEEDGLSEEEAKEATKDIGSEVK